MRKAYIENWRRPWSICTADSHKCRELLYLRFMEAMLMHMHSSGRSSACRACSRYLTQYTLGQHCLECQVYVNICLCLAPALHSLPDRELLALQAMERPFLECEICFFEYNETLRRPLSLPCGHTFCKSCVQSLRNLLCPEDRTPFKDIDKLPTNYLILRVGWASLLVELAWQSIERHTLYMHLHGP
jgi:hypothetical protein